MWWWSDELTDLKRRGYGLEFQAISLLLQSIKVIKTTCTIIGLLSFKLLLNCANSDFYFFLFFFSNPLRHSHI